MVLVYPQTLRAKVKLNGTPQDNRRYSFNVKTYETNGTCSITTIEIVNGESWQPKGITSFACLNSIKKIVCHCKNLGSLICLLRITVQDNA